MDNILKIVKYPDKILREPSLRVSKITEKEIKLFQDMLLTMRNFSGIGLAAPQVGINQRLIVVEVDGGILKLANPEVIKAQGKEQMEEGCLSAPGVLVNVERPYEIIVRALNEENKIIEISAKGLLARAILHEIDHLNGKTIIDYMTLLKKLRFNLTNKLKRRG
ncbi:MAG: peptide deformylase [Candidatus Omnitrophota bacterium]|nr:MAG: peptide deformylase [Candidatus Omnitrophota bacterium]